MNKKIDKTQNHNVFIQNNTLEELLDCYQYNCGFDRDYNKAKLVLDKIKVQAELESDKTAKFENHFAESSKPVIDYLETEIDQKLQMNLRFLGTPKHLY